MPNWSKARDDWYRRALPAYWVFLFCATHFPKPKLTGRIPAEDKLVHVVSFGVLTFLFWRVARSFHRSLSGHFVWLAFVCLGVYAVLDEYLQQFVNRNTSLTDCLADLAGIVLVLVPLELRRRYAHLSSAMPDSGDSSA